jgi:hypothetical protein
MTLSIYAGNESDKIALAIQNSNTTELSNMFNTSIELVTPGSSGITNRDQARIVLENFFRNNVPVKATVTHETNGTTNSMVVINLITKNGTFRISIVGTNKGGTFVINEFKIT